MNETNPLFIGLVRISWQKIVKTKPNQTEFFLPKTKPNWPVTPLIIVPVKDNIDYWIQLFSIGGDLSKFFHANMQNNSRIKNIH